MTARIAIALALITAIFVFAFIGLPKAIKRLFHCCENIFGYHVAYDPIYGRTDRQFDPHVPRQIRLAELQPGQGHAEIVVNLVVKGLGEGQLKYEAVSYVWGLRKNMKRIILDGEPFEITPNLESALRRFRHPKEVRRLWADAVCMNQKDEKERNEQVQLMRTIYEQADRVLIWLGDGLPHEKGFSAPVDNKVSGWSQDFADDGGKIKSYEDNFMKYHQTPKALRHLLQQDYVLGVFCLLNLLARGRCLDENRIPFLKAEPVRQAIVAALKKMVELDWWSRQWVIQETVLARKAILYYHGFEAPWDMLSSAAENFQRHRKSCCSDQNAKWPLADVQGIAQFARVFRDVDDWRKIWNTSNETGEGIRLLPLLWQFRSRTTTDPKDKVYALLPLVTTWNKKTAIRPEYNQSNFRVFREVVINSIEVHDSLLVLMGNTEKSPTLRDLPSWVPDWTVHPHAYELERLKRAELYIASGERKPHPFFLGNGSVLSLKGVRHRLVTLVGNLMPTDDEVSANSTFAEWYSMAGMPTWPKTRYVTGQCTSGEAYWRTLCMDTEISGERDDRSIPLNKSDYKRASEGYGNGFREWTGRTMSLDRKKPVVHNGIDPNGIEPEYHLGSQEHNGHTQGPSSHENNGGGCEFGSTRHDPNDPDGFRRDFRNGKKTNKNKTFAQRPERSVRSDDGEEEEEMKNIEDNEQVKIDDAVTSATAGRKFFQTKGGYMGLGPKGMRVGDIVFVLDGGNTPFLLRPKGQRIIPEKGERDIYELVGDCYVHGIMDGEAVGDTTKIQDVYIV